METRQETLYFDTYLASLITLRLLSIVLFITSISKILDSYIFSQFIEFLFLIIALLAFMKMRGITKQFGVSKNVSLLVSINYLVILVLCMVSLPLTQLSPPVYQFTMDISFILLVFQAMFPFFSMHRSRFILACFLASLLLLAIGFSTIMIMLHAESWLHGGTGVTMTCAMLVLIGLIVFMIAGIKYAGKTAIMHEKQDKSEGCGYAGLLLAFFMIIVLPISFFSWLIFFIIYFMILFSMDAYCERVPPFAIWWLGLFFLFFLAFFI